LLIPIGDDNRARRIVPGITYSLIIINVIVFILELAGGEPFVTRWSFIPSRFLANPGADIVTIFTSMFMHGGWLHIIGNMLYLFIFGDNVEDRFGHFKFLIFYLLCGVAATFAQLPFSSDSNIPHLGASGAIAGVLAAYIFMFPLARVITLLGFFIIPLPALIVIGLWIVLQIFSGIGTIAGTSQSEGIAYMAHVGGFFAGLILTPLFRLMGPRRRLLRY
jgi:membrane associated rhomboid family serine protease